MFKIEDKVPARWKCGHELTHLRGFDDSQTRTRFLAERCLACGEIALIRVNGTRDV